MISYQLPARTTGAGIDPGDYASIDPALSIRRSAA
jgi:hypothetical protein